MSRTITFSILGNENVSAAVRAVQGALKNLAGVSGKTYARLTAQAKQLEAAKALHKQIQNYKALQKQINDSIKAQADFRRAGLKALQQQAAAQKNLSAMKDAYKQLQQSFKDNRRSMSADAANVMQAQIKAARAELKAAQSDVKNFGNQFAQSSRAAQKLQTSLAAQQARLAELRTHIPPGTSESALEDQIRRRTQALNAEIAALQHRDRLRRNFQQARQDLADSWSNFQSALQTSGTILNPFIGATKAAMDFEFAMSRVKALTQMRNLRSGNLAAVRKEMEALTAQAKLLGETTEFTSVEAAQAQGFLGMAGWDTDKILAAMKPILDITSIAGDHNLARTADVFSNIMTAMHLKPGQLMNVGGRQFETTRYFADAMAYALTQSNMDRENFFQAMKYNAPIGATAGLTVGEQIATNMVVASAGIQGSQSGTGMRSGLLTLAGANKKAQQALMEIDLLSSSDAQKQLAEAQQTFNALGVTGKNFSQRVMELGRAFSQMSDDEKLTNAYKIFGKNAATFWAQFLSSDALKDFAKFSSEIDSGAIEGWASDSAAVMRDNSLIEVEYLKSAWDALANAVGDAFLPAVTAAARALTQLISGLTKFVQQHQSLVQWLGIVAGAIAAVIAVAAGLSVIVAVVGFLSAGFALLGSIVGGIATVVAAVGAPVLATIAAFWAFIGVLVLVGVYAEQIGQALTDAWNHPQGAITGFCELLTSSFDSAIQYVTDRWNTFKSVLENPIEAAFNFFGTGSVVGGNVKGYQNGMELSQIYTGGGGVGAIQAQTVAVDAAQIDMPEVDMSALFASIDETSLAFQSTSTEFGNVTNAAQLAAPEVTNVGNAAQLAAPEVTNVGNAAQLAAPEVSAVGNAAQNSVGNINSMASAAGSVASALSAKAAEISAIHIQVPQIEVVHTQIQAAAPAQNATGGIYRRGEFLTTFAEKSSEAAIPLDNSARARGLWLETGSLLGMFDNKKSDPSPINLTLNLTVNGQSGNDVREWMPDLRSAFEELAAEFFGEQRRRSFA